MTKPPFGVDRCGIESVSYVLVLREWTVLGDGEWLQFAIRYFSDVLLFMEDGHEDTKTGSTATPLRPKRPQYDPSGSIGGQGG